MPFLHRVPAPPLDAFIASVWCCENRPRPFALERVLPQGTAQLIINLKEDRTRGYDPERGLVAVSAGTILAGLASRYGVIDTDEQERVAGVAFRAGGTMPFFAVPACELRDCDVPLEFLWGRRRTAELRERLLAARDPAGMLDVLEQTLAAACQAEGPVAAVTHALDVLHRHPETARIADVADSAGLSAKRFIERFRTAVGLAPKQYCRIVRFQRALSLSEGGRRVDWTGVAVDCGYFDQAHFIHDFRSFAGITPTGYQAGRTEFRNHVKFLQSEAAAKVG